jgi:hypothetical protein
MSIVEFVVCVIVAARVSSILIEECHHIDDSLWVLSLLLLGDTIGLQCPLPLLGKTLTVSQ